MGNLLSPTTKKDWFEWLLNLTSAHTTSTLLLENLKIPLTQVILFFFFGKNNPFSEQQRTGVLDKQRSNLHTHAQLSRPRTLKHGENKERTDENDFFGLTKTVANLSSSSPGSGMGSLRGMLCPLRSVCWSMLPAFPMFPIWPTSTTSPPQLAHLLPLEENLRTAQKGKYPHALGFLASVALTGSFTGWSRSLLLQHKAHVREAA